MVMGELEDYYCAVVSRHMLKLLIPTFCEHSVSSSSLDSDLKRFRTS